MQLSRQDLTTSMLFRFFFFFCWIKTLADSLAEYWVNIENFIPTVDRKIKPSNQTYQRNQFKMIKVVLMFNEGVSCVELSLFILFSSWCEITSICIRNTFIHIDPHIHSFMIKSHCKVIKSKFVYFTVWHTLFARGEWEVKVDVFFSTGNTS